MCARPNVTAERIPQILEAARDVFGRAGLSDARMDDIAVQAGLSKATIYLYFKNKDALIAALLTGFLDEAKGGLQIMAQDARPSSEVMTDWITQTTSALVADAAYAHLGFEFLALASRDVSIKAALKDHYQAYHTLIASLIERGIAAGDFAPVDAAETAKTIIAICEGMHLLWLTSPQTVDLQADTLAGFRTILAAITQRG